MSLTAQQLEQLDTLLADLVDQRITDESRRTLEELLCAEPEAQDRYIRFMAQCSDLHELAAVSLSAGGEENREAAASLKPRVRWIGRWWRACAVAAALLIAAVSWSILNWSHPRTVVGHVENFAGAVEVVGGSGAGTVRVGQAIRAGQAVETQEPEAQVTIRLNDATTIMLAGGTRAVFRTDDGGRIDVERGNVTASVRPRPAERPLVLLTPEARIEVLGTRLSVMRDQRRTRVDVLSGEVRVTRLTDQKSINLAAGQVAEVSAQSELRAMAMNPVPDHWLLDFADGLPMGWETGQLIFEDLPEGTKAAVRAAAVEENQRLRHQLRSQNAWSKGLFALHDDSWIHIRYWMERRGPFQLYLVCRQHDFREPAATVLTTGNLRAAEGRQWQTLTLPLSEFHRIRTKDRVALNGELVVFQVVFDCPEQNPGLMVDRIWITRGTPADPRQPEMESPQP